MATKFTPPSIPDLQKRAEQSLRDHLAATERHPGYEHQTWSDYAAILRQHRADDDEKDRPPPSISRAPSSSWIINDGGILAIAGGRDFNQSQFNRAISSARPSAPPLFRLCTPPPLRKGMYPGTSSRIR